MQSSTCPASCCTGPAGTCIDRCRPVFSVVLSLDACSSVLLTCGEHWVCRGRSDAAALAGQSGSAPKWILNKVEIGLVLTEILNIVDLLGHPTVVIIVTVGPAYCCYCSSTQRTRKLSTKTRFCDFSDFEMSPSDFETIPSDFETISSDIEWFAHQIQRKTKRALHPSRPNVGDWEPSVGLLLFTRPTVGQCCWPGPLLFCCYC